MNSIALHRRALPLAAATLAAVLAGCGKSDTARTDGAAPAAPASTVVSTPAGTPSFSLAWSEYPSWSVFGVAHAFRLIDGAKGKMGPIEQKWSVDIELKEADYDACLQMYGAGNCDAVCITTLDALNPALSRPSAVILPTSTSFGADALLVTESIKTVQDLKGRKIHGLAKSVSEYCFVRNLELVGESEANYTFSNMDPGAAAVALQQKQNGFDAIVVWNPFVLETLNKRKDVRVLFDSTKIPDEIIDSVTMSQASIEKQGGTNFACAISDAFYAVNRRLDDPATRSDTLIAIGEKFSHLDLESMKKVVDQTRFYGNPRTGLDVLTSKATQDTMKKVLDFCVAKEITTKAPTIGYGDSTTAGVALRFDPSFIRRVLNDAK
jgi:NitT/TauT family transport system substrate-binding protein